MINSKFIAFYLPQYHPIPQNDQWWGKGFTEWTNVTRAKPLFKNHKQPILPADLGYYDLRLEQTRIDQAVMAKDYGIDGFCYYHYWFNGKKLLERPASEMLKSKNPNFPFCLCWANETWSRRWTGEEKEILIKQEYSQQDDEEHANYLCDFFSDDRYIKIDGRPLFIIYRPGDLPNPTKTIETIKRVALKNSLKEPFLVASNSHLWDNEQLLKYGFDSILNFRPQLGILPYANTDAFSWGRLKRNYKKFKLLSGKLKIFDYNEAIENMQLIEPESFDKVIPCVFVGWDNTARRGKKGVVIVENKPELFEREIMRVQTKMNASKYNTQMIFINAWNEWAEGNKLEPDTTNGMLYLKSIKKIKLGL